MWFCKWKLPAGLAALILVSWIVCAFTRKLPSQKVINPSTFCEIRLEMTVDEIARIFGEPSFLVDSRSDRVSADWTWERKKIIHGDRPAKWVAVFEGNQSLVWVSLDTDRKVVGAVLFTKVAQQKNGVLEKLKRWLGSGKFQ